MVILGSMWVRERLSMRVCVSMKGKGEEGVYSFVCEASFTLVRIEYPGRVNPTEIGAQGRTGQDRTRRPLGQTFSAGALL